MGLRINTNIQALNAHKNLTKTDGTLGQSLERLSSGLRINKAADDASGLAIADTLRAQHTGIGQAIANANDGVNIIQIADGALEESLNIVNTIRTKAIQAASDGQSAQSRKAIQADVNKLLEELEMIGDTTAYNGISLLDGGFINKSFHVGAYKDQVVGLSIGDARGTKVGAMAYAKTERQAEAAVSNPFMKGGQVGSTGLASGDLRLNSVQIDGNVEQLSNAYGNTDSAWSKASAINAKLNESGVQAKATTEMIVDVAADLSGVSLNGVMLGAATNDTTLISLINNNTTFKNMGIRAEAFGDKVKIVADDGRNLEIHTTAAQFIGNTGDLTVNGVQLVSGTTNTITNRGTLTLSNARAMAGGENTIAAGTINSGDLVINGVDVAGGGALTVVAGDTDKTLLNAINNNKELQTLGIRAEQYREAGDAADVFRLRLISEKEPLEISGVNPGKIAKLAPGTTQGIKTTGVLIEGSAVDANPTDDLLTKIGFEGARFGTRELDGASNTGGNDLSVVSKAYVAGNAVNSTAITAGDMYINGTQIGASTAQGATFIFSSDPGAAWSTDPVVTGSLADPTKAGVYTLSVVEAGTASFGSEMVSLHWVGPDQTSGYIYVSAVSAGAPIAGPNGLQFTFANAMIVANGSTFLVTAEDTGDATTAFAKAAAINEKINETGVAAKATTEMLLDVAGDLSGVTLNGINLGAAATDAQLVSLVNNDVNFKNAGIKAEIYDGQVRVRAEDGRNLALKTNAALFIGTTGDLKVNGIALVSGTANTITERGNLTLTNARAMVSGETNIVAGTINQGELIINGVDVSKGGSLTIQKGDSDRTLVNAVNNNTDLQKMGIRAELYRGSGDTDFRMRLISERDDITISGTDPNKVAQFVSGTTTGKTATDIKLTGSLVDGSPTTDNYLELVGFGGGHYGTTEETGVNNTTGNDKMIFGKDRLTYNSGDVEVNGYKIGQASDDGISHALGDKSAAALAAAINLVKSQTGVEADIIKASQTGAGMVAAGTLQQRDLVINGVDIVRANSASGVGMDIKAGDADNALIKAINEYKDQTGVIASIDKDNKLVLTAVDGRNIHVQSTANGNKLVKFEADFGEGKGVAQDSVYMGNIRLVSDKSFNVDGAGSSNASKEISLLKLGLAGGGGSTEATSDLKGDGSFIAGVNYKTAIAKVDVTTQEGAEIAIRTADFAIKTLDEIRSGLGSVQNQLTSTIANLSVTKINVQATESTIRDVDFAAESTTFSKMQVLMQAGTYAQSQANAMSQNVMRLLQ